MHTTHNIYIGASQQMYLTQDNSIDLVVTSPPYPMIEMWDIIMGEQNPIILTSLQTYPDTAFELMHEELDKVWRECFRVIKPGGFLCLNIGDATRTINGNFKLYNNHSRISKACMDLGFIGLPNIIWRKQTNAPNKFMGSGMLPCGAYVTLEHEWILIFRKGEKREFKTSEAKLERKKSSFFWEERNTWFSDIWEVKGTKQKLDEVYSRERSAAFPFEIPYRLINMFSQKGDTVLDPFLGTGTTMQAAILLGRNSCGYEIDPNFESVIKDNINAINIDSYNNCIKQRLEAHNNFIKHRKAQGKEIKHYNSIMETAVMTMQEKYIEFNFLDSISYDSQASKYSISYKKFSNI